MPWAIDPYVGVNTAGAVVNNLKALAELKQFQQQAQTQNTLKQLMGLPGAINPDGSISGNTLQQIMKLDPKTGLAMLDQQSQQQERRAQVSHLQSETQQAEVKAAGEALQDSLATYDAELKDGNVDPKIAEQNLQTSIHDWINEQPWKQEKKDANWKALSGLSPAGLRAAASRFAMSQQPGDESGWQVVTDKDGTQYRYNPRTTEATTLQGQPYTPQGAATKVGTGGGQAKMYQDAAGDVISYKGGQWRNETKQEALEGPPDDLHTMTSGAARSAPAMALQVYMRSPSFRKIPPDQQPEAIAEFNAGFHNVQLGGTASAKADTASLTNITKIADASEAFENTAMKNFDNALRLAPKGIKTNMGPMIEKWVQDPEKALGDPNVPAYQAALLTAANEYAKVIAGSTGSQGSTVDSRREAAEMFSSFYNTDQIENVISVAKTDMDNKIASYSGQREGIKARIAGETGVGPGGTPAAAPQTAPPAGAAYHSAQDVVGAYKAGKLTRDAAAKILRDNGWAK